METYPAPCYRFSESQGMVLVIGGEEARRFQKVRQEQVQGGGGKSVKLMESCNVPFLKIYHLSASVNKYNH